MQVVGQSQGSQGWQIVPLPVGFACILEQFFLPQFKSCQSLFLNLILVIQKRFSTDKYPHYQLTLYCYTLFNDSNYYGLSKGPLLYGLISSNTKGGGSSS